MECCFHIRLPGLGILSKIFGKFMLEIGEKLSVGTPVEINPFTFVFTMHQPRSIDQCLLLAIGL